MKRREFLIAGAATALSATAQSPKKPNIVMIFADDLGIGNLSCYGADHFRTPAIDNLAKGGIRFTRAYTAPLCGPSRALVMTGRYAFRTGATNQDATGRMQPANETFLPAILRQAGYTSVCVGKWGQLPLGPADWGFDEYFQFKGSGAYWASQAGKSEYFVNGQTKTLGDKEYIPDLMHSFLAGFLQRHRSQPFFAYYSMSHIHGDILPTPDSPPDTKDPYGDNIRYMDKLAGKLIAELDRLKLRDNTLVLFMGDNGTAQNFADRSTVNGRRLAGEKGSMQECGALVPFIVNWPGKVPAGKIEGRVTDSTDLLPTFAELAGAKLPAGRVLDGQSMLPVWLGKPNSRGRDWVFMQLARMWWVRDEHYKLNQNGELFDMSNAPFEERLVSGNNAQAEQARAKLQKALDTLNPAGGIQDDGDGSGRHAGRSSRKSGKK
jgi:arylsulfatase A